MERTASVEFLQFLADITDPGTGAVLPSRLAAWLGESTNELEAMWKARRPHVAWSTFADELLDILDAAQDRTLSLRETLQWYKYSPIAHFDAKTAESVVAQGEGKALVKALKKGSILPKMSTGHG